MNDDWSNSLVSGMVEKVEKLEQVGYDGYAGAQDDLRDAFQAVGGNDYFSKDYKSKRNLQGVSGVWQPPLLFSAAG